MITPSTLAFQKNELIGNELQILYNHSLSIYTKTICRSFSRKHRLARLYYNFTDLKTNPILLLRHLLDDKVCRQYPFRKEAMFLYFRNDLSDFKMPKFLPGVPIDMAQAFLTIQVEKTRRRPCREKAGLNNFEMQVIVLFLRYFSDCITSIEHKLKNQHKPDSPVLVACSNITCSIGEIIKEVNKLKTKVQHV